MVEILKDYGKAQITAKCIARVLGECVLCCIASPPHCTDLCRYDGSHHYGSTRKHPSPGKAFSWGSAHLLAQW